MKNSAQKIRTSHVGRLPVPSGFEETALRLTRGEVGGEEVAAQVVPVVADVVKRQVAIGLDCNRAEWDYVMIPLTDRMRCAP